MSSSWSSFASQVKQAKGKDAEPSASAQKGQGPGQVSASSFLNLKADLAASSSSSSSSSSSRKRKQDEGVDFLSKPDRKLPAFLRPSPGVVARAARDAKPSSSSSSSSSRRTATSSWANTPSAQLDAARAALERKAKIYDKLKRGKTAGLDKDKLSESVIDWDRKGWQDCEEDEEEDEEHYGGSKGGVGGEEEDNEPMVEYEDEFGRLRRVPKSEVPREVLRRQEMEEEMRDQGPALYGPQSSFPVYQPPSPNSRGTGPAAAAAAGRAGEYQREAPSHFDASFEKRHRGAGFYQFSQDEETRSKEMDALRQARDETQRARADMSAERSVSIGEQRREQRHELVRARQREMEAKRAAYMHQ